MTVSVAAVTLSNLKYLLGLLQGRHLDSREVGHYHVAAGLFLESEGLFLLGEQVENIFVVDFEVGDHDLVLETRLLVEDLLESHLQEAFSSTRASHGWFPVLLAAKHGVGLA